MFRAEHLSQRRASCIDVVLLHTFVHMYAWTLLVLTVCSCLHVYMTRCTHVGGYAWAHGRSLCIHVRARDYHLKEQRATGVHNVALHVLMLFCCMHLFTCMHGHCWYWQCSHVYMYTWPSVLMLTCMHEHMYDLYVYMYARLPSKKATRDRCSARKHVTT